MATQQEVADYLDINPRHVRRLISEGILPASKGKGGLCLDACRMAYIRYLRGLASGQVKPTDVGESENGESKNITDQVEEQRLRKLKRENDIEEQLIAPVDLLTEALAKTAAQVIPIMDSLPLEMKRRNPNLTGHDIQLAKKSIAKCRNLMSEAEIILDDD